jgi:hypothetical protein
MGGGQNAIGADVGILIVSFKYREKSQVGGGKVSGNLTSNYNIWNTSIRFYQR